MNMNRFLKAAFLLSGCTALIYEVIWIKKLGLAFGATTTAGAVVISAYMAGLGLGSIFWGRRCDRSPRPLMILGWLEAGTGAASVLTLLYLKYAAAVYRAAHGAFNGSPFMTLTAMAVLSFIITFLPTFLMGGTFPVISKVYIARNRDVGKGIGSLYALNTLGGVIGCGLAGFAAIRSIGMVSTSMIAAAVNISLGAAILLLSRSSLSRDSQGRISNAAGAHPEATNRDRARADDIPISSRLVLAAALITGFCGLGLEIIWIRILSTFLPNTAYTFTVVLIVYLSGIALGSALYRRFLARAPNIAVIIALLFSFTGLFVVATAAAIRDLPSVLFSLSGAMAVPLLRIVMPAFVLALVLMLIPTLAMGIVFPALCSVFVKSIKTLGSEFSSVYLVNTAGCIAGPLAAAFLLIPALGAVKGVFALALIMLAIGVLVMNAGIRGRAPSRTRLLAVQTLLTAAAVVTAALSMKNTQVLPPSLLHTRTRADRILYYRETVDGTVVASEDRLTGIRACHVNNSAVIGTTYDAMKVVKMLGHLPWIANPEAKRALVIGFGVGITTASLARHPLEIIDCVEICPGVRRAAAYFTVFNNDVMNEPRVRFIGGDGRNYLLVTGEKYDIISCDPTHPTLGSGNLYTREYFALCKDRLTARGVFCQYLPLHKLAPAEFKTAIRTFASVFDHATVWLAHSHAIMVGTQDRLEIPFERLQSFAVSGSDDILIDPYLLAVSLVLDEDGVARFCGDESALNTDDRPVLEYFTPLSLKKENWQYNVEALMSARPEINSVVTSIEEPAILEQYLAGQSFFIEGLKFMNQSKPGQMIEEFKKAAAVNPLNEEIKKFIENQPRN